MLHSHHDYRRCHWYSGIVVLRSSRNQCPQGTAHTLTVLPTPQASKPKQARFLMMPCIPKHGAKPQNPQLIDFVGSGLSGPRGLTGFFASGLGFRVQGLGFKWIDGLCISGLTGPRGRGFSRTALSQLLAASHRHRCFSETRSERGFAAGIYGDMDPWFILGFRV